MLELHLIYVDVYARHVHSAAVYTRMMCHEESHSPERILKDKEILSHYHFLLSLLSLKTVSEPKPQNLVYDLTHTFYLVKDIHKQLKNGCQQ